MFIEFHWNGADYRVPAKYEVCPRCRGKGTHTNPAIDGHGISSEEMDELGEEFREDYINGFYDIRCTECDGERVVKVVDTLSATYDEMNAHNEYMDEQYMYEQEMRTEREMGY